MKSAKREKASEEEEFICHAFQLTTSGEFPLHWSNMQVPVRSNITSRRGAVTLHDLKGIQQSK